MKTFHNGAGPEQIGSTILMSGDPLWVKYTAQTYLTDAVCYNRARRMNGYAGYCKGKKISAQGSGTEIPSMGTYAYELCQNYDMDTIIRIGTTGVIHRSVEAGDLTSTMGCCTSSDFPTQYHLSDTFAPIVGSSLLSAAVSQARGSRIPFRVGNMFSSDVFYEDRKREKGEWKKMDVLVQEMETLPLYCTIARVGKRILGMLIMGNSIHMDRVLTNEERERNLDAMIQYALEIA